MFSRLQTGLVDCEMVKHGSEDGGGWRWLLLIALLAQGSCAHSRITTNASAPPRSADMISRADINKTDAATAADAVRTIRRHWISTSRVRGDDPVRVYVDDVLRGGVDELRYIRAKQVMIIQYFNARDATTRWGTGHSGGVIHVELLVATS